MKIRLEIRHVSIPFRFAYGHSKATHRGVELILCMARDGEGRCGYGEAVPRTYVTGETCDSVMRRVVSEGARILDLCGDVSSIRKGMVEVASGWEGPFPSCAFCAIEMAVLDLMAYQQACPFYKMMGERSADSLQYSASIGLGTSAFVTAQLLAYRALGLRSFKLKVGGENDEAALQRVHAILGQDVRIFVDANGAWDRETAARKMEFFHKAGVWGVEEPLRRRDAERVEGQYDCEQTLDERHFKDNAWLRARSSVDLIADESVISVRSMRAAMALDAFDVVDVRLSKLGGAMLSSHIVDMAREHGMKFYIGAMVGETPILAAAGSHFGTVHADHLCIQGYSHQALHGISCFSGGSRIQRKGRLVVSEDVGLGVSARWKRLDQVTLKKETIEG